MEALKFDGRVAGKTKDGRILIVLTVEEYMRSLPEIYGTVHEDLALSVHPQSTAVADQAAGNEHPKPPRKARRKPDGRVLIREKADKGTRICVVCGKTFAVRRKDQVTCGGDCKVRRNAASAKEWRERKRAVKPSAPAAPPPELGRAQRLAAIREAAKRVNARHADEGSSLHVAAGEDAGSSAEN